MIVWTTQGKLNVHRAGEAGQPVVLLHPLALSGAVFDPLAAHLAAAGRTVLATDTRGHGESGWDGNPFTIEDLADDTAAMVDTLGVGPVDVIGLSMGGSTALVFAANHPGMVRRLIVADASADYGPDRETVWAERAVRATTVAREEQLSFQWDRWFTSAFRATNPSEVNRVSQIFLATDSAAHAAACHALGGLDATALLPDIAAETLVLVGDEDYATPPAMSEEIAKEILSARLEILDRTRHLSLVERPDVWPLIVDFLA
jgi:3-oxoadipate enol-lactonase